MPPALVEKLLWFLLPPACREHVLGDLQEKSKFPKEYTREGFAVLAPVIASRIRRTTDYQLLLIEAFAIYLSFLAGAWYFEEKSFLYQHSGFARLALPTFIAVIAMLVGNAYFEPVTKSRISPILQSTVSLTLAFLGQALIFDSRAGLNVPLGVMLFGSGTSVLFLSILRTLFPPISPEVTARRLSQLQGTRQAGFSSGASLFEYIRRIAFRYRSNSAIAFACAALLLAAVVLLGVLARTRPGG